ncbi:MAG: hypothetical protein ABFE07_15420 [Armatimonadia bacterium]
MDCATCHEHYTDVLEGSQSPGAVEARLHLEQCATCAADLAGFKATVADLRSLPQVTPPADLLSRISRALDEVSPTYSFWRTYWHPVAASASMAACCLIALWAFVLNPVNVVDLPQSSPFAYNPMQQAVVRGAEPAPAMQPQPPSGAPAGLQRPYRAARGGGWMRGQGSVRPPMVAPPAGEGKTPTFGSWGAKLVSVPVAPGGGSKPTGTFATGDDAGNVPAPLQRQAGEVQLAFVPPVERPVGVPVVGQLVITGQAEAVVRVSVLPHDGLRVMGSDQGVLYRGEMRRGQKLQLPVRMVAARAGTHRLQVRLEGDVPGVAADLEAVVPGFIGEAAPQDDAIIKLVFREVPSSKAIREMAAAVGARVVLHEGVNGQLVTQDYSAGVPFKAALKILCDACAYRIETRGEVYHIHVK